MGFTLIELLVVVAILSLLAGMLSPALKRARDSARQIHCVNNLRNIGNAINLYAQDNNEYLPHAGDPYTPLSSPNATWKYLLAPYLQITTRTTSTLERGIFHCTAKGNKALSNTIYGDKGFYGGYGWNFRYLGWRDVDEGSWLGWIKLSQVDKPAETIVVGDTNDDYLSGAEPRYVFFINETLAASSRHNGGGNYLWLDVHVSWQTSAETAKNYKWFYRQK
ncbi:MAG: type II secretion system protein [Verrucomicrobiae bacterium]|nr:type II secretion system protein [Verrucomicrobiae bacterium]